MQTVDNALDKLEKSEFRAGFKLNDNDREYISEKGLDTIRLHAADFVRTRISSANPVNDGKQTPMKGHPVFKDMHATACCCRGCLNKWYKVPLNTELTPQQQEKIVNLLKAWIDRQLDKK